MSWEDNVFPDADNPEDVGWMITYWRTQPCKAGCKGNYSLHSRQFDHLVKAATREEALERFYGYVKERRNGKNLMRKNHVLFLSKVEVMERITTVTGEVVDG